MLIKSAVSFITFSYLSLTIAGTRSWALFTGILTVVLAALYAVSSIPLPLILTACLLVGRRNCIYPVAAFRVLHSTEKLKQVRITHARSHIPLLAVHLPRLQ